MLLLTAILALTGCYRPTDSYNVAIYGQGTTLDEVLPAPEPMGGLVEVSRVRLWGDNLGMAFVGGDDRPRSDGREFVYANAAFGYPINGTWARGSFMLAPGPDIADQPACVTLVDVDITPGPSAEYVDVGDHLLLSEPTGASLRIPRTPAVHPRPAGESFYAGYGGTPMPYRGRTDEAPTWFAGEVVSLSFPGTVGAPEATHGFVPRAGEVQMRFPDALQGVTVGGVEVGVPGPEGSRFEGPWQEGGLPITWDPAPLGDPVTLSVRYLASSVEIPCDGCTDCGDGFSCEPEDPEDASSQHWCTADEGNSWLVLGETTCTVPDSGAFTLTAEHVATLSRSVPPYYVDGAVLTISRRVDSTIDMPDAMTFNGKRIPITPARTRASDVIFTRIGKPPPLPGQDEDGNWIDE